MKVFIVLLFVNFVIGLPDLVSFEDDGKDARPIEEHPDYKEVFDKLYYNEPISRKGGRILNGIPATLGQFPYQALLKMYYPPEATWYICGGNFIKYNFVLTVIILDIWHEKVWQILLNWTQ